MADSKNLRQVMRRLPESERIIRLAFQIDGFATDLKKSVECLQKETTGSGVMLTAMSDKLDHLQANMGFFWQSHGQIYEHFKCFKHRFDKLEDCLKELERKFSERESPFEGQGTEMPTAQFKKKRVVQRKAAKKPEHLEQRRQSGKGKSRKSHAKDTNNKARRK